MRPACHIGPYPASHLDCRAAGIVARQVGRACRSVSFSQRLGNIFSDKPVEALGLTRHEGPCRFTCILSKTTRDIRIVVSNARRFIFFHKPKCAGGRIVNIASVAGLTGYSGLSAYSAAKASLLGFTHLLAREVGPLGITVNAVAPGFIDTEMTHSLEPAERSKIERVATASHAGRRGRCKPGCVSVQRESQKDNGGDDEGRRRRHGLVDRIRRTVLT